MTVKAAFKIEDAQAYVQQQIERSYKAIIQTYQFVGETFVRNARLNGNYQDITGNLRSSIGYIILQDGRLLDENFEQSPAKGTDKATGVAAAERVAELIGLEYPKGIALVCVAGMDYAVYVEAKGLDVITDSELRAATQLKQLLAQL